MTNFQMVHSEKNHISKEFPASLQLLSLYLVSSFHRFDYLRLALIDEGAVSVYVMTTNLQDASSSGEKVVMLGKKMSVKEMDMKVPQTVLNHFLSV